MTEREHATCNVQQHQFAVIDAALFLDTHPDNAAALNYFQHMQELCRQAEQEYETHFGPLTHSYSFGDRWNWVDGPWPWEGAR